MQEEVMMENSRKRAEWAEPLTNTHTHTHTLSWWLPLPVD